MCVRGLKEPETAPSQPLNHAPHRTATGAEPYPPAMSDPFNSYSGGSFPGVPPRQVTDYEVDLIAARYADVPVPTLPPVEVGYFDAHLGSRRSAEVLYHHPFMGSHSTAGQSEPLYSSNNMAKRPRLGNSLTIYPQQPGEKACAFYMRNRTCKYGEDCRFDHPQWISEGGIPNWREVQNVENSCPEGPGEPDCPQSLVADNAVLPVRPSEPVCSFYKKKGNCKFGAMCKFNHPKDTVTRKLNPSKDTVVPTLTVKQTIYTATVDAELNNGVADGSIPDASAEVLNAKGLPIRPGAIDCSFYMKTGSCMYGSTCRYNHPDRPDAALAAPAAQGILRTPPIAPAAVLNPIATFLPGFDIHGALVPVEPDPMIYPQRPGETVCDFYMKTGYCKFGDKCKFHHPLDRAAPRPNGSWDPQQTVTLTLAGLPRREDAEVCAFYMKSGTCKFGSQCKFDHPPPGEAIAKLTAGGKKGGDKAAAKLKALAAKQEREVAGGLENPPSEAPAQPPSSDNTL